MAYFGSRGLRRTVGENSGGIQACSRRVCPVMVQVFGIDGPIPCRGAVRELLLTGAHHIFTEGFGPARPRPLGRARGAAWDCPGKALFRDRKNFLRKFFQICFANLGILPSGGVVLAPVGPLSRAAVERPPCGPTSGARKKFSFGKFSWFSEDLWSI